jgi:hypothetical protein
MPKVAGTVLFAVVLLIDTTSWAEGGVIQIARDAPYKDPTTISNNIVTGCLQLGTKLSLYLNEFATKYGVETELVDSVDPKAGGRVLVVEITNAISSGNAFVGHRKSMSAKAELFEAGESKGYVNFTRDSGGGFAGGYKGSCAVLGRCSKALGKDIAGWLRDRK